MPKVKLHTLAHARSGDKGSHANIAIIARKEAAFFVLENLLTADRVADFFAPLQPTQVLRYTLPKVQAFNFVLENILNGGGSSSLRLDAQGKALGQLLLEMEIAVPDDKE